MVFDDSETQPLSPPFEWSETKPPSHAVNWWKSEPPSIGLDDLVEGVGPAMPPAVEVEPKREYSENEKAMLLIMFPCLKDLI